MRGINNYLHIYIESDDAIRYFNETMRRGIYISDVRYENKRFYFKINRNSFHNTEDIIKRYRIHFKILKKHDFTYIVWKFKKNSFVLIGIFISVIILQYQSIFLWGISYDGNNLYSDEALNKFLMANNITDGIRIKDIDLEKIGKEIKEEFPNITWVNSRLDGNFLKISISESKSDSIEKKNNSGNIYANFDGVIDSLIVRSGTSVVNIGDEVKKGDLLVENKIYITDDYEQNTIIKETFADADVYISSSIFFEDSIKRVQETKVYNNKVNNIYKINVFGMNINWGKPKDKKSCDVMYTENRLRLTNNISLPIILKKWQYNKYSYKEYEYSDEEMRSYLDSKFKLYIQFLKRNKVQIKGYSVNINSEEEGLNIKAELDITAPADFELERKY